MPHPRSLGDFAVIAVFLVLLLAPAVLALTGHAGADTAFIESHEQRRPFVAPPVGTGALATGGYERDLERQIADGFPLRSLLIASYDYAKFAWFGASTSPNVVRGRDGWLFFGAEERKYVTGAYNPSDADLARVADFFAARARRHARNGTHYILVFAPNKSTVYASEAPAWYQPKAPTPLDRLIPMLRARAVTTVDVRAALQRAARDGEVYSRGDTHWNDAGAVLAYRAVTAAAFGTGLRDAVPAGTTHVERAPGDLLNLSGVGTHFDDSVVKLDYAHRAHEEIVSAITVHGIDPSLVHVRITSVNDPKLPAGALVGDSFSVALAPMFAEDFRLFSHLELPSVNAAEEDGSPLPGAKPDVVVQELVERSLVFSDKFGR